MIKPPRNPYGYRNLLVYQKAEELQLELADFVSSFPKDGSTSSPQGKTLVALADQMERSARSTKQNIVEGWKRNSTNEYYQFLGFAVASNAELEADCTDIIKGIYGNKGIKGIEKGVEWVETIPFYPLDPLLPLPLQLKLRAKELNFLLERLQRSLADKMGKEGTLTLAEKLQRERQKEGELRVWYERSLNEQGFKRLENGRVVKKDATDTT